MKEIEVIFEQAPPAVKVRANGETTELPALWLRERSQDPAQLDRQTQQRLFDSHAIDPEIALLALEPVGALQARLAFSDGHSSLYDFSFLHAELDADDAFPAAQGWDSALDQAAMRFSWPDMQIPERFLTALDSYLRYGFVVLTQVPTAPLSILDVAAKFGYLKETNFGRYFEVFSSPMPTTWPIPGCISARIPTTPIAIPCRASSCCTVWSTRPAVACRPWWTASAWSVNWPRRTPRATGCSRTPRSSTASSTAVPSWSATSRSSRPTPRAAPWACITAPPRWPAAAAARAAESLPPRPPASGRTVLRPGLPDPLPPAGRRADALRQQPGPARPHPFRSVRRSAAPARLLHRPRRPARTLCQRSHPAQHP
ncbi:DUF971 domain-containing protein [Pseudomonas lalucatii]|nr:DUF971 domain-containing protein [Pseudomonas lalucatii]